MTHAAQELHLTQSGVSQHIRSFEDVLEIRLFDRVKGRLIPTHLAATLYSKCTESLNELETTLSSLKGIELQLSGVVNIGMPMEFGNNIVLPHLSRFCKMHPGIRFSFRYGLAGQVNEDLLRGDLDFAFVDGFGLDKRITTQAVYNEVLLLCAADELFEKVSGVTEENRKFFESLSYVDYQVGEPVLRMWFAHHLGTSKLSLNVRATVMNVQGVAHMIQNGLAAGVLPGHLVSKFEKDGLRLRQFEGCGTPLKNKISVAYLQEKTQTSASLETMKWLMNSLQ